MICNLAEHHILTVILFPHHHHSTLICVWTCYRTFIGSERRYFANILACCATCFWRKISQQQQGFWHQSGCSTLIIQAVAIPKHSSEVIAIRWFLLFNFGILGNCWIFLMSMWGGTGREGGRGLNNHIDNFDKSASSIFTPQRMRTHTYIGVLCPFDIHLFLMKSDLFLYDESIK